MVTEFFPRSSQAEITGGVEARCFYLARELRKRHDVLVLANYTDGSVWEYGSAGSIPRRLAFLLRALWRGLRSPADVIDGSNLVVFPLAWILGLLKRRPVVFWYPDVLIGAWRGFGAVGLLGEIVERLVLKLPLVRFIAISRSTAEKLVANGVAPGKVSVVPCGYDASLIDAVRNEPVDKEFTICCVSRLVSYKRVDLVLDAVALLAERRPDTRLIIVGRGPEEAALRQRASDLGITERVDFHGYVREHREVLRIISHSNVFVAASEIEGFGIALVEAMALGVPYVVSDIPAFVEVSGDGTGGKIFPKGNASAMAGQISKLQDDPDLYRRSARQGQDFAERYRWSDVAAKTEAIYVSLVRPEPSAS